MSAAFTSPYDWARGGQDLAGANEIMRAWYERAYATFYGGSIFSPLTVGTNAQARESWGGPYWYSPYYFGLQGLLEGKKTNGDSGAVSGHPSFVDHINGPLNATGNGFLYFTRAAWQEAAGLNVSAVDGESYRRVTEMDENGNPVFGQFGYIQSGDIRGPWIFEDIQKGLAALKWVTFPPPVYYGGEYEDWSIATFSPLKRYGISTYDDWQSHNKEDAYAKALYDWGTHSWYVPSGYYQYSQGKCCEIYKQQGSGGAWPYYYSCAIESTRWRHRLEVPTFCSRAVQLWIHAKYGWASYLGGNAPGDQTFGANDDLTEVAVAYDKLVMAHETSDCVTLPIDLDYFASTEAPEIGPEPTVGHVSEYGWSENSYNDGRTKMLIKFNFTNA